MKTWTNENSKDQLIILGDEKVYKGTVVQRDDTGLLLDADYEKFDELNSLPYAYMYQIRLRDDKNRIDISYSRQGTFTLFIDDKVHRNEIYQALIMKFPKAKVFDREHTVVEKGKKPLLGIFVVLIFLIITLMMRISNQDFELVSTGSQGNVFEAVFKGLATMPLLYYFILFWYIFDYLYNRISCKG